MTELNISQVEADRLIRMEKRAENNDVFPFPDLGGAISIPLVSADLRENFFIDVSRGRINLLKGTNQLRSHQVIVLVRLDFNGPPHRNPDGEEIACPHMHIYREGYGDKWAYPLPEGVFSNLNDGLQTIQEFMGYCNVTTLPEFKRGLFT
jgi:Family of unknown function (DUF6978)